MSGAATIIPRIGAKPAGEVHARLGGWRGLGMLLGAWTAAGCYPNPNDLRPGGSTGLGGCLGAACTGAGGSTGSDGGVPPFDTTAYANAFCDRFQACAPTQLNFVFATLAACQARLKIQFDTFLPLPDTGWTAPTIAACAAGVRAETCTDFNDDKLAPACNIAGRRMAGQGCRINDQCASRRCVVMSGQCGTCAPRLSAGGSCVDDGDCTPPLVCTTPASGAGSCVMPVDLNAACDPASAPCRYSLSCRDGFCATPGGANVSCADFEDCDFRHGFLCNLSTFVCGSASASTTTCGAPASNGSLQYCPANGYCSTSGNCLAAALDNRPCSATGPLCTAPAACVNGTCTLPTSTDCR